MTTIGYATLQIIPSLKGVTEAIEKQVEGKAISVTIEPKVDTRTAQKAGKQAGEVVTKEVTAAVRKGDIGKTVGDEIASSAKKSSGKEAAKAIVDGIASGVKQEMPRGGVGEAIVDGIADGVKQGIDGVGIGGQVVTTIGTGIKSGNLGGTIRDAIVPAIKGIGDELRSGAATWAGGIADSLRSGDIQGATKDIGDTVRSTTDLIAEIGTTFGLQIDGVRVFGDEAATTLSKFGTNIQGVITTATGINETFNTAGDLLEKVLPGKAGAGAAGIARALGAVAVPAWLLYLVAEDRSGRKWGNGDPVSAIPSPSDFTPGQRSSNEILYGPYVGPFLDRTLGITPPGMPELIPGGGGPNASRERRGLPPLVGRSSGGYTGSMPIDQIAGVVHGGEYVIKAASTAGIENAMPGLLDYLNNKGSLPGYKGGGLVTGSAELGKIISQRFGVSDIGGWRPADSFGEHSTGRALDVMTSNKATGDAIKDFAIANASAIDLKWAIWQQKLWYPDGSSKVMKDRGSPTENHMDHVHIFSGPGITNGLLGSLKGASANPAGMAAGPDMVTGSGAGATSAADSGMSSSTTQGVSLASSLSGMAGSWSTDLGKGVGKTKSGSDLSLFSKAGGNAVTGQVASALGAFGIGDSPGWLKGISSLVSGIKIGGSSSPIGGMGGGGGAASSLVPSIAPLASAAASTVGGFLGGGGQQPIQQTNFNIQTTDVEPAYLVSQRVEKERAAANLARIS